MSGALLEGCGWPLDRPGEALEALAEASGLAPASPREAARATSPNPEALERVLVTAGAGLGLEIEATETPYGEVDEMLRGAAPALLRVQPVGAPEPVLLAVTGQRGRRVTLLRPDRTRRRVTVDALRAALCSALEAPAGRETDELLERAGVPAGRRERARKLILRERLGAARIGDCWLVRLPPGASFWRQVAHARLPRALVGFLAAHVAAYLVMLLSWWVVGNAALQGRLDGQWLIAWVLLLLTQVPLSVAASWSQGLFAIGVGGLLKLRLLGGALRLEPEEIRREGAGQLLGRVIESGAVESMALSAGFNGLVALVELAAAGAVLTVGPGGWLRLALFLLWVALTLLLGRRYYLRRRRWTEARLVMTNDLVERMVGHRTRLAQEPRDQWHEGEDRLLSSYIAESLALDRIQVRFGVLLSRGWMLVGLIGLIPTLVLGQSGGPVAVAVALGGVLLTYRALGTLSTSLTALAGAAVAWQQVRPLFLAAARSEPAGSPTAALGLGSGPPDGQPVLEASDLVFGFRQSAPPVLQGCSLKIHAGERLLLEGPSGGGKTTLASLLVGLRRPQSGLVLLHGLDRQTLGAEGWRRLVVSAPQFHENHVMTGTFAFNLLMGRTWPAGPRELDEAETICRELGLGPLLARMPAGLLQVVGDTGWRLSHGEQSRLFMARALLQGARLIVLDESFAALDPASLRQCLETVLRRAPALLVIAHP